MLIVAPTGNTNLVILLSTWFFSSAQRKVTGRVAELCDKKTKALRFTNAGPQSLPEEETPPFQKLTRDAGTFDRFRNQKVLWLPLFQVTT